VEVRPQTEVEVGEILHSPERQTRRRGEAVAKFQDLPPASWAAFYPLPLVARLHTPGFCGAIALRGELGLADWILLLPPTSRSAARRRPSSIVARSQTRALAHCTLHYTALCTALHFSGLLEIIRLALLLSICFCRRSFAAGANVKFEDSGLGFLSSFFSVRPPGTSSTLPARRGFPPLWPTRNTRHNNNDNKSQAQK